MILQDFTVAQLHRFYRKLYYQLYPGDPHGWDWPTLRAVYPAKAAIIYRIADISFTTGETPVNDKRELARHYEASMAATMANAADMVRRYLDTAYPSPMTRVTLQDIAQRLEDCSSWLIDDEIPEQNNG